MTDEDIPDFGSDDQSLIVLTNDQAHALDRVLLTLPHHARARLAEHINKRVVVIMTIDHLPGEPPLRARLIETHGAGRIVTGKLNQPDSDPGLEPNEFGAEAWEDTTHEQ